MSLEVCNVLIALIAEKGNHSVEELTEMLNSLPEYNAFKAANKRCKHELTKGTNEGKMCDKKVSKNGEFCSKHTDHSNESSGDSNACKYIISKGSREGQECNKKVSDKCEFKLTCSSHLKHGPVLNGDVDAPEKKVNKKVDNVKVKCDHVLTTGVNEGKTCGTTVTEKSPSKTMCTRHANASNKKDVPVETKNLSIKKIKGTEWFLESGTSLLFNKDRKVLGRYNAETKTCEELVAKDMVNVKEFNFKILEGVKTPVVEPSPNKESDDELDV